MSPFSIRVLSAGSCLPAFLLLLALLLAVGLLVLGVFAAAAAPPAVPAAPPLGRRAWWPPGRIFFGVPRAWPCYCFVPVHVPWVSFAAAFPLPVPFPPEGPMAAVRTGGSLPPLPRQARLSPLGCSPFFVFFY